MHFSACVGIDRMPAPVHAMLLKLKKPVMWPYFYCIFGNFQCIINVFADSGRAPMDGVQLIVSDIPGA